MPLKSAQRLNSKSLNPKIPNAQSPKARALKTRLGFGLLAFALMTIAAVVAFWRPGLLRGKPNSGHQLGGDIMSEFSGNTIECFTKGIREYESSARWRYSECDIRETKDNHLIIFHDWDISGLPDSKENRSAIGEPVHDQPISELTLQQVQGLTLNCGCRIPTLAQVLETAVELKPQKPILLEFKYLHSDVGRERLLELATLYRDQHSLDIHFLAFIRNVKRCFPDSESWLARCSESGFCVYQVYRPKTKEYDLCETWK